MILDAILQHPSDFVFLFNYKKNENWSEEKLTKLVFMIYMYLYLFHLAGMFTYINGDRILSNIEQKIMVFFSIVA